MHLLPPKRRLEGLSVVLIEVLRSEGLASESGVQMNEDDACRGEGMGDGEVGGRGERLWCTYISAVQLYRLRVASKYQRAATQPALAAIVLVTYRLPWTRP